MITVTLTHPKVTLRDGSIEKIEVSMRNCDDKDLKLWISRGYKIVKVTNEPHD